jgi:hypothetical protein
VNGKEAALARTDEWFKNVFTGADHGRVWASTETNVDLSTWRSLLMVLLPSLFIPFAPSSSTRHGCIITVLTNWAGFSQNSPSSIPSTACTCLTSPSSTLLKMNL